MSPSPMGDFAEFFVAGFLIQLTPCSIHFVSGDECISSDDIYVTIEWGPCDMSMESCSDARKCAWR